MEYGGSQIMEKLMNILMEIDSSIAWDKEEKLIDDRIMDSFMVISLISELEDQFQIEIDASEIKIGRAHV